MEDVGFADGAQGADRRFRKCFSLSDCAKFRRDVETVS